MYTTPNVIRPGVLSLLKQCMADSELAQYTLVGGTALALHLGHRLSVDLDLFTPDEFDSQALGEHLDSRYKWQVSKVGSNLLMGFVDDIKVDFVRHNYAWNEPLLIVQGVRMASALDIAAIKFNAIAHSGQRQKDFYDLYTLLEHYSLDQLVGAYILKYSNSNRLVAIRSLTYFGDINFDREPALMAVPVVFDEVRARLHQAVLEPFRTFG